MILETFVQGSAAWHKARLGIPTASHFDEIVTPKLFKPCAGAKGYRTRLLAEWITGIPADAAQSGFMDRGKGMEERAAAAYAYEREVDVQKVGCVLRDDRMAACSPDRLVGEDGALEIKVPSAATHIRNLLEGMGGYAGQVQGCLWLTGRKWIDLVSWHPEMPMASIRIERDEEHIAALEEQVSKFVVELKREREALLACGCVPADRLLLPLAAVAADSPEPF